MSVQTIALMMLVIAIAWAIALYAPPPIAREHDNGQRPLVELSEVPHGGARSIRADLVGATLINGLGRSEMFDLRIAHAAGDSRAKPAPARYRLSTDLLDGEQPRLFLRLWEQDPDRLLWSGDVALPPPTASEQSVEDALAPVIATIGRINGLIAIHEYQRPGAEAATGYRCILLYHRYRKERLQSERSPVIDCVERSLAAKPDDAPMQAIAAQLALDRSASSRTPFGERAGLFAEGLRHAQLSISIDPLNPWAIVARARIAALRQSCPLAVRNAMRATQLQPYDPSLLAEAGVILLNCGDARTEGLIRQAIALDDGADGQFYGPLLLLAISRDDRALAREALSAMTPPVLGRHVVFYMVTAAGYAMVGDLPRAQAAWRQLKASSPAIANDPETSFERLGYTAPFKDKAMQHLRAAKLIR